VNVLFASNLFPDATEPNRGLYNARLLHALANHCEIRVVSPRPTRGLPPFWSPKAFSPRAEDATLAPVFPPAAYLPKIGSRFNHRLMARTIRGQVLKIRERFAFDVILASWLYPDACAVAQLATELRVPVVAIAQGSDAHQYLQRPARRKIIVAAMQRAAGVVARSRALAGLLREAGVADAKLRVIYNGVDTRLFRPGDRAGACHDLNVPPDETVLLYVGNLSRIKNPFALVEALPELNRLVPQRKWRAVFVGDGPLRHDLVAAAKFNGVAAQVQLAGPRAPAEVARFMQAADALCVTSDDEGMPNVILEAFACGLPVVATNVGGIPEILTEEFLGQLVKRRNPPALAAAVDALLAGPVERERIVAHGRTFSWERTAAEYFDVLTQAVAGVSR
jgi:teichuronic acid biosynthesis glycosyltransferase TuaC